MGSLHYQPLDTTKPEIRVLAILPSFKKSSTIKCRLVKVDLSLLDEAPFAFYEALSYTWGDATNREAIILNGYIFQVTRNLAAVLRRLRGRTRKRYLWVDAICINQNDLLERKSQVMKMKMIYEKAIQALVWLGEEANNSGVAMDLIEKITDADTPYEWISASLENPEDLWQWQALSYIFDRPYWRRVWIRQEVAVASEIYVLCGNRTNKWTTLVMACEILFQNQVEFDSIAREISHYSSGYHQAVFIDTIREYVKEGRSAGLQHMLFHNRACESTDPRDRVFAVLGLVSADEIKGLEPDYSMQKEEVFKAAVESVIHNTRSLDVLSACQSYEKHTSLPSWVPDLEADWEARVLREKEGGEDLYHAAADIPIKEGSIYHPDKNALALDGIICDEIVGFSSICESYSTLNEVLDTWRNFSIETLTPRQPLLTEEEIFESFWRTIIADQDLAGDRATKQTFELFSKHIVSADKPIPKIDVKSEVTDFTQRITIVASERKLIGSKNGRIGLASANIKIGDLICIFHGAGVPFVLRKESDHYFIVCESYIHGLMDGEAIHSVERGEAKLEKLVLY